MKVILAKNVTKSFKTKVKKPGILAGFQSLIKPQYANVEAVKSINIEVSKGEILAFIGPNGAGKSTTIKMMTGILYPTSGDISVLGLNPSKDRVKLSYKIGSVFGQKSQLSFHLPAIDSFHLLGAIFEVDASKLKSRIDFLTELFELKEFLHVPVRKLSLGQRIRCEIAASILHEPEIIFLDEPTIGLDVVVKQKIRDFIIKLNQEDKTTIFLTSHDTDDIEQICERAIIINHGEVVFDDTVKQLKSAYLTTKVIIVRFLERVNVGSLGFNYVMQDEYTANIEINTSVHSIHDVMDKLTSIGGVADITISDQPLEKIISEIFQRKKAR